MIRNAKIWMLCTLFFVFIADAQATLSLDQIKVSDSVEKTKIVLTISSDIRYSTFSLKSPRRWVIDLQGVKLNTALPKASSNNSNIIGIRSGTPQKGVLRLVFELRNAVKINSTILTENELHGHQLVFELFSNGVKSRALTQAVIQAPQKVIEPAVVKQAPQAVKTANRRQAKKWVIAIDAGHGGQDSGARGYRGSYEKRITLSIAKKLQAVINRDPRMESFLVRKGDYFIKLNDRRYIARDKHADLFISIHADAFTKRSARGFSVFALSQRGSTSAMAAALAKKENASDLIGGVSLKDKDIVLQEVLVDLSMTNTIKESLNFGGRVLKELKKLGKLHSKRVEQAGFAVLKSADIPSVLIETGFITNPSEEQKLRSERYQQKVARSVYKAIREYHQQTPFYNTASYASPAVSSVTKARTKLAGKRIVKARYHKIVRGDSLSKIAQRYGLTLKQLKQLNRLKSNTAFLGQRLKVSKLTASKVKLKSKSKRIKKSTKGTIKHTVRIGESLSSISVKYNVRIRAIKTANKLKSNTLVIGKKLIIPN